MKKIINYLIALILLSSCSKKSNDISLAKNYFQQSQIETEENNFSKALQLIDKSIELHCNNEALAHKATLHFQLKQFQESLSLLKKIISDKKTNPNLKSDSINNYACTLFALGQTNEAEINWLTLTYDKHYISPEVAWFNLGLCKLSQFEKINKLNNQRSDLLLKAKEYFINAIQISREYTDAYFYLAITLINLKEYKQAKQILITLLSSCPEHENAKNLLTKISTIDTN